MIVLLALVGCESSANKEFSRSKVETTKLKLVQYANEAYPRWAMTHPDKQCPETLSDLDEQLGSKDANDSWGRPIKMVCGPSLPPGVRGLGAISVGEDGKEGTEDDLKSWD